MKWQGKQALLIGVPLCLLIVVAVVLPKGQLPANLDLIGMIKHIHSNNDNINSVNDQIVGNMVEISHLTDTTTQIDGELHTLQKGLSAPDASLVHLDALSQQEIDLSTQFRRLATQLNGDLGQVNQAADSQQNAIQQMIRTTKSLTGTAQQVVSINGTVAGKLSQATKISDQVAQEMP